VTATIGAKAGWDQAAFVIYQDANLFLSGSNIASPVLSAQLPGYPEGSEVIINFCMTVPKQADQTYSIVFWRFDGNAGSGGWDTVGCELVSADDTDKDEAQLVCGKCDHLTHFAVLGGGVSAVSAKDAVALELLSTAGLSVSIILLVLCAAVHLAKRKLREYYDKKILIQLCLNLALAFLLFVTAAGKTHDDGVCAGVGIALHYVLLTSFMWMLMTGLNLYTAFVVVFSSNHERRYVFFNLVAYFVPAVIVGTTLGAQGIDAYAM
jgi:hypothetical protein